MSMYAFLPLPADVKANTNRRRACRASTDGSSISISLLARTAYSSLVPTADRYPLGWRANLTLSVREL